MHYSLAQEIQFASRTLLENKNCTDLQIYRTGLRTESASLSVRDVTGNLHFRQLGFLFDHFVGSSLNFLEERTLLRPCF